MSSPDLESIENKLDTIIALLRVLASEGIGERRRIILSTEKKREIYDLCDGSNEMSAIAEKAQVSGEYVRLTIRDLEDAGFVQIKKDGNKRYPERVI